MTWSGRQRSEIMGDALHCLSRAEALRDSVTRAHEDLVGLTTVELCLSLGLDPAYCRRVSDAARLHDIGKFALPSDILHKPGRLSREEWAFVRKHTETGHRILNIQANPFLQLAATIALHHHEKFDGSGYPRGLSGEEIPLEARIVSVADAYDALRADQPYKRGVDHERAISILTEGDDRSGPEAFDPAVLRALERSELKIETRYGELRESFGSSAA